MSTEVGRRAETVAAEYLKSLGHKLLVQNWRTRWCEIDLVTQYASTIYFVEVKYRRNTAFGGGLEYITPIKLAQMQFAAEFWLARNVAAGHNYRLAALEVTGPHFAVTAWLDEV